MLRKSRIIAACMSTVIVVSLTGCSVTSGHKHECEENKSINLNPIIGLFGMAVDGDDKDDYEHFFENDDKCCKH
jgi:hypothetical protein